MTKNKTHKTKSTHPWVRKGSLLPVCDLGLGARGPVVVGTAVGPVVCGLRSSQQAVPLRACSLGMGRVPLRPVAWGLVGGPSLCSSSASPTASSGSRRRAGQQSTALHGWPAPPPSRGPQFLWPCLPGPGACPPTWVSAAQTPVQLSASTVCRAAPDRRETTPPSLLLCTPCSGQWVTGASEIRVPWDQGEPHLLSGVNEVFCSNLLSKSITSIGCGNNWKRP